jgi:hypothetical protein
VKPWLNFGLLLAAVTLGVACSGVNASHSVSPASFFLPGLIRVEPAPVGAPETPAAGSVPLHLAHVP